MEDWEEKGRNILFHASFNLSCQNIDLNFSLARGKLQNSIA